MAESDQSYVVVFFPFDKVTISCRLADIDFNNMQKADITVGTIGTKDYDTEVTGEDGTPIKESYEAHVLFIGDKLQCSTQQRKLSKLGSLKERLAAGADAMKHGKRSKFHAALSNLTSEENGAVTSVKVPKAPKSSKQGITPTETVTEPELGTDENDTVKAPTSPVDKNDETVPEPELGADENDTVKARTSPVDKNDGTPNIHQSSRSPPPYQATPLPSPSSKLVTPPPLLTPSELNAGPQEEQERVLVNDLSDPSRYSHILVDRRLYRKMVTDASKAKDKGSKLLNEALDLVFTKEELKQSTGMGLRKDKNRPDVEPNPLDPLKVEAVIAFTKSFTKKNHWDVPSEKIMKRIISNKITNSRRIVKS